MIQKIITTTLITLIFGFNCYSQVPGYMGSRFSIEGDLNVLPWFTNALKGNKKRGIVKKVEDNSYYYNDSEYSGEYIYNNNYYNLISKKNSNVKHFTFNLRSSLSISYSLSKKVDFSLKLDYTKSKFVLNNFIKTNKKNVLYNNIRYTTNLPFFSSNEDQIPYQLMEYNFNFKIYTSKFIAPVGNYFLFGLGYSQVSSKYDISYIYNDTDHGNNYQTDSVIYNSKNVKQKASFLKFNVGFYKKRFVSEKLYITTGLELNAYFLGKYSMKKALIMERQYRSKFRYSNNKNIDKEIEQNYKFNIGRHISIDNQHTFNIGIGLIL